IIKSVIKMKYLILKLQTCFYILILLSTLNTVECFGQNDGQKPPVNIFMVIEEVNKLSSVSLWPGFKINEIPVAIYDSLNTYLLFSTSMPEGFAPMKLNPEVLLFKGQHPFVRGNSIVRFGETWTATSVLSNYSRRTNELYTVRDMAGIIVHEQFHVFQRINHPHWRQNDGVLLFYPVETEEAFFLRRIEKEAFRRAVTSENMEEKAGWVKTAFHYREQRMSQLGFQFSIYEKELQRTEGLSEYIEKIARNLDSFNALNITNGIAPAGVRDLGYIEGRWIAMILDKFEPGWKFILEQNDSLYLEDILKDIISKSPYSEILFNEEEIDKVRDSIKEELNNWLSNKKEDIKKYKESPGYCIEIKSSSNPFNIRIFDPLEIEILDDGGVYHRVIFSATNNSGSLRIQNHPCISYFDNSHRLTKLVIFGLKEAPVIIENENKFSLKYDNITIELKYSKVNIDDTTYSFEIL
ncbi:hypothetical protein ACFLSV_05805, partial [Bacteroidota bacterium]